MQYTPKPDRCPCGRPFVQSARGRPQRFCSDPCRRAADQANRARRTRHLTPKPVTCRSCGGPIQQPATGRPRKLCNKCRPTQARALKTAAQNVLGALQN
jgi:hypothetical protein